MRRSAEGAGVGRERVATAVCCEEFVDVLCDDGRLRRGILLGVWAQPRARQHDDVWVICGADGGAADGAARRVADCCFETERGVAHLRATQRAAADPMLGVGVLGRHFLGSTDRIRISRGASR